MQLKAEKRRAKLTIKNPKAPKELGKLEEAEKSYKKAIELKQDYTETHYNLGNVLLKLGKLDEAETSCKKTIELKPDFAQAHNNLGLRMLDLHKLEEAQL